MALKHIRQCPACEMKLFEGGKYCPCCGHEFDEVLVLTKEQIIDSGFRSFCQHCFPVRPLVELHRFCPYCQGEMHLYIDALEDADCLTESEFANLTFRIRKVGPDPVTFLGVRAASRGRDLGLGRRRIYSDSVLRDDGAEVEIDFHYDPGEIAGRATIEVELVYMAGHTKGKIFGTHDLRIARTDKNLTSVTFNVKGHLITDDVNVYGGTKDQLGFAADVVEEQREGTAGRYVPLECRTTLLDSATADTSASSRGRVSTQTARIWFEMGGRLHNYCLLTQPSVTFGRREGQCDVRLLEVEMCLANIERQAQKGVPKEKRQSGSYVSGRQWQMDLASNGLRLTQLSRQSSVLKPSEEETEEGKVRVLDRNDSIEIPGRIGLRHAASAPGLEETHDWYMKISKILGQYVAPWSGDFGGYRLDRLYSLCEDLPEGLKNYNTLERYILMPGWCTIGSSPEACIHIPDYDVASIHAHLLFGAGHFFVTPASGARVGVDGNSIQQGTLALLGFEQRITLGNSTLVFDEFVQMHV